MRTRILDVDESVIRQHTLLRLSAAEIVPLDDWGPSLRIACSHASFRRFEERLTQFFGCQRDRRPFLTYLGSGDFHHLSLALLRRLRHPCNLLIIDNHPDWMRGVPLLHCGTWLYHAARLANVHKIFHVGGDVDFDNTYRWLAPWSMLRSGKIVVAPARRRFRGRCWANVENRPLRRYPGAAADRDDIEEFLDPFRGELAARPLYISLDKDVLITSEAAVNWDSGHLTAREVMAVLKAFTTAAGDALAGMDVIGDWSPVRVRGLLRHYLHWMEHPTSTIDAEEATRRNEALNLRLWNEMASLGEPRPLGSGLVSAT